MRMLAWVCGLAAMMGGGGRVQAQAGPQVVQLASLSQGVSPEEPREPGAPLSLTATDGSGLRIVALEARAVIEPPLAMTELHLTFQNPGDREIEGQFSVTLPPGATVSRFAMRQTGGWREGEVVELRAARRAYEDFLHRRQDPALLEKKAGNQFTARVFPIPSRAEKQLIVSYSEILHSSTQPYRVYLHGLPQVGRLDLRVVAGQRAYELHRRSFVPDADLVLPLEHIGAQGAVGVRHQNLLVARVRLEAAAMPDPLTTLAVLFDTSASRALGFPRQVARLEALIARLAGDHPGLRLRVTAFDQEVEEIYSGPAAGCRARQLRRLLERGALGASDLGTALASLGQTAPGGLRAERALLVTDGIATAGATRAPELRQVLARLRQQGLRRLDVVVEGGIRDEALLRAIANGGLERAGIVADAAWPTAMVAHKLARGAIGGIQVRIPGAAWVWPAVVDGVQPGDEVVVYADLPARHGLELRLESGAGTPVAVRPIRLASAARPLIERAWVHALIARLSREEEELPDGAADARGRLHRRIVDLSTRFRVLCDETALLVLETEADYARFNITRRSLAEILVVGAHGIEVVDRRRPDYPFVPLARGAARPAPTRALDGSPHRPERRDFDRAGDEPSTPAMRPEPRRLERRATEARVDGRPAVAPRPRAAPGRVILRRGRIEILDRIYFGANSSEIHRYSQPILDAISATLRGNPQIIAVEVQGHTASSERDARDLARRRAEAVVEALRRRGVTTRLEQFVAATMCPLCTRSNEDCQSYNRRVEFVILVRSDELGTRPVGRCPSRPPPERPSPARKQPEVKPYTGRFGEVMDLLRRRRTAEALVLATKWRRDDPGDVLALVALGEALEARGRKAAAGRAYGAIIDLFPGRADLRRLAGNRLERVGARPTLELAADTYRRARDQRPDHPSSHRLLAYALLRLGRHEEALAVITAGADRTYPEGRFAGVPRILREDVGLIGAAWVRHAPALRPRIVALVQKAGTVLPTRPSLRFVLTWETDANDVDFHIRDRKGGHAYYSQRSLASGGELYDDVTTGYGPECFAIEGTPGAYPYRLQAHYYRRGPMGYGMGKVQIIEHDGRGGLRFDDRPFVVMTDDAFVDLGSVAAPGARVRTH